MHNFLAKSLEGNPGDDIHSLNHPSYEKKGKNGTFNFVVPTFGNVFRLVYEKIHEPSRAMSLGSCYLGQLTDEGRKAMRFLGSNFRKLYVDQLGT